SIGGGMMEHKLVELAKAMLAGETETKVFRQIHEAGVSQHRSGMICSGEQTVLLHPVSAADTGLIESITEAWNQLTPVLLEIADEGLRVWPVQGFRDTYFAMESDTRFVYREYIGFRQVLQVVGGGHCALALSKLMAGMDFFIRVLDDRPGLSTMESNAYAHEMVTLESYEQLERHCQSGDRVYTVIMTFGFRTDDQAFRSIAAMPFRYIGILGSQHKMKTLFDQYRLEGMPESFLQRVRTPIGVSINSQTPEEIAISIAAEIIAEKNKR
ncbi:MAG TPA: XdhC family protein, partial [Ferruginibacter sp.]|nr:XdhC family protein [Ferruginibacter sp.]